MSIVLVQTIQLACFASIFLLMAQALRGEQRAERRGLLWLAATCAAGSVGTLLPPVGIGVAIAAPVSYALLYMTITEFAGHERGGRWIVAALAVAALVVAGAAAGGGERAACAALGIEALMTAHVLLGRGETETRVPRAAMAAMLGLTAAVSAVRVVAPEQSIEEAAEVLHLLSSSVLPIGFLWMLHARQQARMARENTLDPLTELLNRRGLEVAGGRELARYGRGGRDFAIVVLDIDHFKRLNDVYAHAGGDTVLRRLAELLREQLRVPDTVGRLGGEEFVLLLPDTDGAGAQHLIERLRTTLAAHSFRVGAVAEVRITASFGITCSAGREGLTWGGLLHEADLALYAAKHAGRNMTRVYSSALADPLERRSGMRPAMSTGAEARPA